ncbi:B12-binding domain-containing radical SAM protein, partial [Candidatus Omnitrophota bacterium]
MTSDNIPKKFTIAEFVYNPDERSTFLGALSFYKELKEKIPHFLENIVDLEEMQPGSTLGWFDIGYKFRFDLKIPKNLNVRDLYLEMGIRRYTVNCSSDVQPTTISIANAEKLHSCGELLIPYDYPGGSPWNIYTVPLSDFLPDLLKTDISVFVDDGDNYRNVEQHYGVSFLYARIYSTHKPVAHTVPVSKSIDHEVILVMCPVWDVTLPPISVACIASYLREKGMNPLIFDLNVENYLKSTSVEKGLWHGATASRWNEPSFVEDVLDKFDDIIHNAAQKIAYSKARVIAFSIYSTNVAISAALAKKIKKLSPDKRIVFGGPGVLFADQLEALGDSWDYLVIGDGESPLYEIITDEQNAFHGIVRRSEIESIPLMSRRNSEPDLNKLPLLSYEGFELNKYLNWWRLPAYTSRGCCRRCTYCFDWNYYSPYRYLFGEQAYEHLINMYHTNGRKYFEFSDLLCNGDIK